MTGWTGPIAVPVACQTPYLVCAPGNGDISTRHRDMMNDLLIEPRILSKRFATENVPFREQSGLGGLIWLNCHVQC